MKSLRLFLHIGHPKTGTTSIQLFLHENRKALSAEGILVPFSGLLEGRHEGLTKHYFNIRALEDRSKGHIASLKREVAKSGCRTVVLSSETFIQENPSELARLLGPEYAVFVIYYIRRQDLIAESVYAQRVRSNVHMEVRPIDAVVPQLIPRYLKHITPLALQFGRDRMLVRPFEKTAWRGNDLLSDFLTLIGADPERYSRDDRRRNRALKRNHLEFKRACNLLPLVDQEQTQLMRELDALSAADNAPQPRHCLPQSERIRILASCAEENAAIARDYLNRPDGVLFTEPPPEDDSDMKPIGPLPPESQHAILNRLSPGLRETLEFIDRKIRLRLPGEAFLPVLPDDPDSLHPLLVRRDAVKLERRIASLEQRLRAGPPDPPRRERACWNRVKRLAGKMLRMAGWPASAAPPPR